uniref:Uncharacterized protein n=1 Tax=Leptobrachium leishanense TaxID=445787 RepID=A0A8C5M261_9ANUR
MLQARDSESPLFMGRWETELNQSLSDSEWGTILFLTHHGTQAVRYHESSYKILACWYCTPLRLFQCVGTADPNCWRCGTELGSYLHIWWTCPLLQTYWKWIRDAIRDVTDITLDLKPQVFLLLLTGQPTTSFRKSVAFRLLLAARYLVPRHWRRKTVPSLREWVTQVDEIYRVEERIASRDDISLSSISPGSTGHSTLPRPLSATDWTWTSRGAEVEKMEDKRTLSWDFRT